MATKYVIEIPDEVKWIQYIQQTEHGTQNLKVESVYNLTPYTESDRQVIEDEVWDFVSRLIWSFVDREILGMDIALAVRDMTYQEAKEKYEAWRSRFVTINNKKYKIVKEGDGKCILEEI